MRFGVLGPLAVWTSDGAAVRVPEAKVRALLANLLVHHGHSVTADRLADDLWGEHQPGNPTNTLQTKISQLRRALEAAEPGSRALLVRQAAGYQLRVEGDAVDAHRFRELVAQARASADTRETAGLLGEALALWRGPVLADVADEPFAQSYIQRLQEERLAAIEERAAARLELGDHTQLAGELGELVAAYPLRERLRGLHLRALYQSGRQSEALAGYGELRRHLAEELGLEPGPELVALHEAILRQDRALATPAAVRARTNLPVPPTELLGRETAVGQVRSLLEQGRLVTLTGPGGVGKTRLALETAAQLVPGAPDGVWLVELAGLDRHTCPGGEPGQWVPEAVAAVLGILEAPGPGKHGDLTDQLADALREQDLLLVLDNCEFLVEPVAELVTRLLRAVPRLRILATSQQPLGLRGEVLWTVPPLGIPARGHVEPARPAEEVLASVREFSGVRLFVARAAATAPGFTLNAGNVHAVAAICRRLDGLPLALELAATRVRGLGVHELLNRLDDRFRLLATGHRDSPARQQTLRAMLDWSWELLTEAERIVLRRLAVHAESCDLAAAEAVCVGAGVAPEDVLDLLTRLVDRSLVVHEDHGSAGPRYRLLESVVAYSLDRLDDAGEAEQVRLRHADHYTALAERADAGVRGAEQRGWLDRLDTEAANVRTALDTLIQHRDGAAALRLTTATAWYWFLRGRIGEARRSLRSALDIAGDADPSARAGAAAWLSGLDVLSGGRSAPGMIEAADGIADAGIRARALWFLGYVLGTVGHLGANERLSGCALQAFRALGDRWGTAAALADHAGQLIALGRLREAQGAAEESAALFAELGDRWGLLQASFSLGSLAEIRGDYDEATCRHRDGLYQAEQLGLWPEVSYQLSWLGRVALLTGDLTEARRRHEQAMRVGAERGFAPGEMYARTGLALGARREGKLAEAEQHLLVLRDWHCLVDHEPGNTLVLAELGFVAEKRGDADLAARRHAAALVIARRGGDPRAIALTVEGLAGAAVLAGDAARGARLLGAAGQARESAGAPLPPAERGDVDRITAGATAMLGEEVFAAEHDRGATLGLAGLDELLGECSSQPAGR
ncbi:BTAD domain-containing putative transcriptional regulator [Saccharomonospora sp. NPDC046836]|uniref:BTAD domain-containing putative transcriptional regulator n=1 Tax=Saccharomonospora sp. NPDC046836 TaxID=3156921 RepID=UPI0033DEE1E8